jgi:cytochrome c oxidase subunit 1
LAALIIFIGFNLTFFPQFVLGYVGMPRRYWQYPPEYQVLNVLSTAGSTILAVGYLLPMVYFSWSLRYGKRASDNPWGAAGLEWMTASPPPSFNFEQTPIVTWEAYDYENIPPGEELSGEGSVKRMPDNVQTVFERRGSKARTTSKREQYSGDQQAP